ncbi:MAG: hypothetical protein JXR41_06210 [Bacteroidales bacterium]|nr:hypothetical protein [Bacteroidales bacterium]MBN2762664.1 hypothetical protein [Bacteroidales bacterium]
MKNNIIHLAFITLLFSISCSEEADLATSIFIPDDEFPELPAYTEWGYNTFGAYYDRQLFIYNDYYVPAKVINTGEKTSFVLKGTKNNYNYYYGYDNNSMSVSFDLYGFLPDAYIELIALNDTTIDLLNPLCKVVVTYDTIAREEHILNGTLQFKRAQNLIVDKRPVEVILSGYFSFQALVDDEPISVTSGRFDVGIGYDNFFRY